MRARKYLVLLFLAVAAVRVKGSGDNRHDALRQHTNENVKVNTDHIMREQRNIPTTNIAEVLAGDNRFMDFLLVVAQAGLLPILEGDGQVNVFAPTNEAFDEVDFPVDSRQDVLESIVLNHISREFAGRTVTTMNGEDVIFKATKDEQLVNNANLEQVLFASNGLIYVIDSLLIPPTAVPTESPSKVPTTTPTLAPSRQPTEPPSMLPSAIPSSSPSVEISSVPSVSPSKIPSSFSSSIPTGRPMPVARPTTSPVIQPTVLPTSFPTQSPTVSPAVSPTAVPTRRPTQSQSLRPTTRPPSVIPTGSSTKSPTEPATVSPTATSSASHTVAIPTATPTDSHPAKNVTCDMMVSVLCYNANNSIPCSNAFPAGTNQTKNLTFRVNQWNTGNGTVTLQTLDIAITVGTGFSFAERKVYPPSSATALDPYVRVTTLVAIPNVPIHHGVSVALHANVSAVDTSGKSCIGSIEASFDF